MIWWAMGAIVGAAGLALLVWAMLWDRSRGRLRCPKCWYAMEGAPAGEDGRRLCPECGRRATDRGLHRTRRRWRWAGVAVIVLLGAALLAVQPKVKRDGWMGLAPTRALIELAPIGGMDGAFGLELRRRMGIWARPGGTNRATSYRTTISADQQLALFRRIGQGNLLAKPGDERWKQSYGRILQNFIHPFNLDRQDPLATEAYIDGAPADDALREAIAGFFETPATLHVSTRDRWARGVQPMIELRVDHGWIWPAIEEVDIRWSAGEQSGATRARGFGTLPIRPEGDEAALNLEVDVVQDMRTPERQRRVLFTEEHILEWNWVDGIDDIMTPLRSAEVDEWLASWIKPEISRGSLVSFALPWGRDCPVDISDVAFGIRIHIMENGEEIASQRVRWMEYYGNGNGGGGGGDRWDELKQALQERGDSGKWSVRLRPDPEWAMYMIEAERYWDGDITLPLTVIAPPPPAQPPQTPEP